MTECSEGGIILGELVKMTLAPDECLIASRDGKFVCVRGEHPGCNWVAIAELYETLKRLSGGRPGDSAIAGALHEATRWQAGQEPPMSEQDVLAAYAEIPGYAPADSAFCPIQDCRWNVSYDGVIDDAQGRALFAGHAQAEHPEWWASLREHLQRKLSQGEVSPNDVRKIMGLPSYGDHGEMIEQ